jgi:hypothetical protein
MKMSANEASALNSTYRKIAEVKRNIARRQKQAQQLRH